MDTCIGSDESSAAAVGVDSAMSLGSSKCPSVLTKSSSAGVIRTGPTESTDGVSDGVALSSHAEINHLSSEDSLVAEVINVDENVEVEATAVVVSHTNHFNPENEILDPLKNTECNDNPITKSPAHPDAPETADSIEDTDTDNAIIDPIDNHPNDPAKADLSFKNMTLHNPSQKLH